MSGHLDTGRLTLHQLRVFLAVRRRGSFTRAAEDLRLTQSAVSTQVRALTDLLGVPLFEQVGKRIYLSEAGHVLEEQAARIEGIVGEIAREFLAWGRGEAGVVRVGGSTSIGTYFLPSLIAGFSAAHPGVEVSLEIENSAHIQARLLRNEFDAAFVGAAVASPELAAVPVLHDEIYFAAAPSHPAAARRRPGAGDLAGEKLFVREPGSATRLTMESYCRDRGIAFAHVVQLGSVEAIKQAVMAGLGISYFSSLTVRHEVETGRLVRLRVRGVAVRRTFHLVTLRSKRLTPALGAFVSYARNRPAVRAGRRRTGS